MWTRAFAPRTVGPALYRPRSEKLARRKGGVVSNWPVMTMTDQGDAIRVPVHVNVFQHGLAKMDESACV
jgi:hypothetical protein